MNSMTAENLKSAFSGESQAHMRYRIWGDKATKDNCPICKAKKELFIEY